MDEKIKDEIIKDEPFEYIKELIKAESYKNYRIKEWGGCDLIIISEEKFNEDKEFFLDLKNNKYKKIVYTKNSSSVIWLIETLKPYIKYDYLNKYTYYSELADIIINILKETKDIDEKELLEKIIKNINHKWKKRITREDLDKKQFINWYNFGIEHNDPFFVKFIALWMAFNEEYNDFPGIQDYYDKKENKWKTGYGVEHAKINELCESKKYYTKLESVHEKIFDSKFIEIFKQQEVKDEKAGYLTNANQRNYYNLIHKNGNEQTKALLQTIYQVRCNLVHGSKNPDVVRDINLVRYSGDIMEIYMKAIFES